MAVWEWLEMLALVRLLHRSDVQILSAYKRFLKGGGVPRLLLFETEDMFDSAQAAALNDIDYSLVMLL